MGVFFDDFAATPEGGRPPARVSVVARLRAHAGQERVILELRLDDENGIFFQDVEGNPGRHKVVRLSGNVSSSGTRVAVTAPLVHHPNDQTRTAFVRAALLRPGSGTLMERANVEILIR